MFCIMMPYTAVWWAVEGLGLSLSPLPLPPKQGHSGFRDFRVPRVRRKLNPAHFRSKLSDPHSPITTPIHFIRHWFQLFCSYISFTYLVYVVLTFQFDIFFDISNWIFTSVNSWLKLQIRLVVAIKGFNRSWLSCKKNYKSILSDYKNDKKN